VQYAFILLDFDVIECVRETKVSSIAVPPPSDSISKSSPTPTDKTSGDSSPPSESAAASSLEGEDTSQTDGFVKQIVDYKLEQIRKTWGRLKEFFYIDQ
jgi:hypothetical protein